MEDDVQPAEDELLLPFFVRQDTQERKRSAESEQCSKNGAIHKIIVSASRFPQREYKRKRTCCNKRKD